VLDISEILNCLYTTRIYHSNNIINSINPPRKGQGLQFIENKACASLLGTDRHLLKKIMSE